MGNWKEYRLGDIVEINKRSLGKDFNYKTIEYIDTSSVTENKLESPQIISQLNAPSRAKRLVQANDTIISTVRPIQKHYAFIKKSKPYTVVSTGFAVITPKKIDPKFLYYFLTQEEITVFLNTIAESGSTTFPAFKPEEIANLTIYAPENKIEQEKIGEILSSLDDKIELNNQINQNIEALAQALFKQWFIDFDFPNENGQPYKYSGGEMIESEFGEIPKGWSTKCLFDYAIYVNGAAFKDMYFTDNPDAFPVIKIVELKYGITSQTKYTSTNLGDKYKIDTGDILFSWSGSPETSIDTFLWVNGKAWLNQHIFKINCNSIEERAFVFSMLKYWKPKFISIARDKQTTGLGHVTVKDLKELIQTCPSEKILKLFSSFAIPNIELIQSNLEEISRLTELRNTLLPQLISGDTLKGAAKA